MAGRPTVSSSTFNGLLDVTADGWKKLRGAWAGGKQIGELDEEGDREKEQEQEETIVDSDRDEMEKWDLGVDDGRGWILGIAWLIASAIEQVERFISCRLLVLALTSIQYRPIVLPHSSTHSHPRFLLDPQFRPSHLDKLLC